MVAKQYLPKKGDFISVTFDPQSGHEQKGRRPALVVSSEFFNEKTGLAIVCPITNTDRSWPLHLRLTGECILTGVVMIEQVKSIDYTARKAQFLGKAPDEIIGKALAILDACIFDNEH